MRGTQSALRYLILAAATLVFTQPVTAQYVPGAGITGTPHDFTLWNPSGGDGSNTINVGKCTFCHTPHRAQQSALIWNHTLSSVASYSWTDTTTTVGGTPLPTIANTWNGATKLCLSCHDGSVAIGDVAWFNKAAHQGASAINARTMAINFPASQIATVTGQMNKNHPVAHPFPYTGVGSTYNSVTTGVAAAASGWAANPAAQGIRLFTDTAGSISVGATVGATGIECSSCHDPHNADISVTGPYFLRGDLTGNSGSYLCTKCHVK